MYTIAGHIGDGNFHIIPLMRLKDPKTRDLIPKLMDEIYALVIRYNGSITAEHNDGLIRTPFMKQMFGEKMYAIFEEVKHLCDPRGILNPRKKVAGSLRYALDHLKKE
jgi:FAD/FMN-containing dehydrogenase